MQQLHKMHTKRQLQPQRRKVWQQPSSPPAAAPVWWEQPLDRVLPSMQPSTWVPQPQPGPPATTEASNSMQSSKPGTAQQAGPTHPAAPLTSLQPLASPFMSAAGPAAALCVPDKHVTFSQAPPLPPLQWQQWRQQPEAATQAPSLWSRASPEPPLLGGSPAASDACNQPRPYQLDDSCDLDASHLDWLGGEEDQMRDMLDLAGELGLLSPPKPSSPTAGRPPTSGGTPVPLDCGLLSGGGQPLAGPEPELMSVFSGGLDFLPSGPLPQLDGPPAAAPLDAAAQPDPAVAQPAPAVAQPALQLGLPGDSDATQVPAGRLPPQARQRKRRRSSPQQPPAPGSGGASDASMLPPPAGAPRKPRRQQQPRKRKSPAQQAAEEQPQQGKQQKLVSSAQEQQTAPGRKPTAGRKRAAAPARPRRPRTRSAAGVAEAAGRRSGPSMHSTAAAVLSDQQVQPQPRSEAAEASADALLAEMLGVLEDVQAEKRQQAQQARLAQLAWQAQHAQQARQARLAQLTQQAQQLWQA